MSTGREKPRVGELRPSQILTTFGIGSIVDLPHISVMVMVLEDWPNSDYREITEERLLASVRSTLGGAGQRPPVAADRSRHGSFEPVRGAILHRRARRPVPPLDALPPLSAAGTAE